jgi:hypothetical protein
MNDDLSSYERVIQESIRPESFYELGKALASIRDRRLYHEGFGSFQAYCLVRWDMAKRTAYQFIAASEVVDNVRNCAPVLPANEYQARPLTRLIPDEQRVAWTYIYKNAPNGKITSEFVKRAVEELFPRKNKRVNNDKNRDLGNIFFKIICELGHLKSFLNQNSSQTITTAEVKRLLINLAANKPELKIINFGDGICISINTNIPELNIDFSVYRKAKQQYTNRNQFGKNGPYFRKKFNDQKDPYQILGIDRNANVDEIKSAHRTLVKQYHPDQFNNMKLRDDHKWIFDEAEERMKVVNWAFDQIKS